MTSSTAIAGSVALVALLAACTTPPPTDAACLVLQPIRYSASQDSPETVAQVRRHNASLIALCPALAPR